MPEPDDRCANCGCPMTHPVLVDGYLACQDCAERAGQDPVPAGLPVHNYIHGPYGPCWRCGRVREDIIHPQGVKADMPPSTTTLLGYH